MSFQPALTVEDLIPEIGRRTWLREPRCCSQCVVPGRAAKSRAALSATNGTSLAPTCPDTEKHQHQHARQHKLLTDGQLPKALHHMPPLSVPRRAQTLKQARKAYQRTSKTYRLTPTEIAAAERRVELQERADRIKEREARRRANLKRKEEKIAKEKERAAKLGKPFDNGKHWHIGPSQLDLGRFFGGVNAQEEKPEEQAAQDALPRSSSLTKEEQRPVLPPMSMPPPPRPMKKADSGDLGNADLPVASKKVHEPEQRPNEYDDSERDRIEDFFVSNTQIATELFMPTQPPSVRNNKLYGLASSSPRLPPAILPCHRNETRRLISDEALEFFESISTQDFNFPFEPTQQLPTERELLSDVDAAPFNHDSVFRPLQSSPENVNGDKRGGLDGEERAPNTRWAPCCPKTPLNVMSTSSFSEDDLTDHDLQHLVAEVESQLTPSTGGIKT